MKTTIEKIKEHNPCGLRRLIIRNLGRSSGPVTLLEILNSSGVRDAYWALRCWPRNDYASLRADVAESVYHWCDDVNGAVRKCINGWRDLAAGKITDEEFEKNKAAVFPTCYAAASASPSVSPAFFAAFAAAASSFAAYIASTYITSAEYDEAGQRQWEINEELMRVFLLKIGEIERKKSDMSARLRADIKEWNKWRDESGHAEIDLRRIDLSDADLSGANLTRANLKGADLTKANLRGADLLGATGLPDVADYLKSCIKKWESIRGSKIPLGAGTGKCALCYRFMCDDCPLAQRGAGCLSDDSNWQMYYYKVHDNGLREYELFDVDDPKLKTGITDCCNTMIDNLSVCLQEEKWDEQGKNDRDDNDRREKVE